MTWVRIIRGDIESPSRRMETELEMFVASADAGISIDQVTINQAGVAFVVDGDRGSDIRRLLGDLNVAVRVREGCSKLSIVGSGMRDTPGVVREVVEALSRENVEIIHCTDSNVTISILVPAADAARAESAVHDAVSVWNEERPHERSAGRHSDGDGDAVRRERRAGFAEAERLARWLVDRENDGLVVAGSTGEGQTLDDNERNALFAAVKEAVGDAAVVIANAGTNSTRESVRAVQAAEKAGADAILAVVPYYNKPTQRGMLAHFSAIADATRCRSSSTISRAEPAPTCCRRRCYDSRSAHGNIAGVKESSGDLKQIGTILRDRNDGLSSGRATIICSCRAWRWAPTASSASRRISVRANIARWSTRYRRRERRRSGAIARFVPAAHRRAVSDDQPHCGEMGDGSDGLSRRAVPSAARRHAGIARAATCGRCCALRFEPAPQSRIDARSTFSAAGSICSTRDAATQRIVEFGRATAPARRSSRLGTEMVVHAQKRRALSRHRQCVRAFAVRHRRLADGRAAARRAAEATRNRRRADRAALRSGRARRHIAGLFPWRARQASRPMLRPFWKCDFPDCASPERATAIFATTKRPTSCATIAASGAKLLFAGLGSPRQEFWLARHLRRPDAAPVSASADRSTCSADAWNARRHLRSARSRVVIPAC